MSKHAFPDCIAGLYYAAAFAVHEKSQESLQGLAARIRDFEVEMPKGYFLNGASRVQGVGVDDAKSMQKKAVDIDAIARDVMEASELGDFHSLSDAYSEELEECERLATEFLTESGIRECCENDETYQPVKLQTMMCVELSHIAHGIRAIAHELHFLRCLFSAKLKSE